VAIQLPTGIVKASTISPKSLFIYSPPKCGKTTLGARLKDSLLIDLENGSDFVDGVKIKINSTRELQELGEMLKKDNPYRYGILDTTTKLEELVLPLANYLYKCTPMGVNYTGENVLMLPNGGGYLYLREAYMKVINLLESVFPRMIYFGHLKDKMLEKAGKEVSARDIDLTGKLKNIACANSDAIGYLYRDGSQTILTFKTSQDVICGARPEHLRNQEIVMLETIDGKLVDYWDKIYLD
jgi:hypothetical protein